MKKACFFGMGSIGTRHAKNLRKILSDKGHPIEIHAFRSSVNSETQENCSYIDRNFTSWESLEPPYDFIFITNPTFLHFQTLLRVADFAPAIFIEKPVFHTSDVPLSLLDRFKEKTTYVACPLRFHPVVQHLKTTSNLTILTARIICSSFLPLWRKGRDYRNIYSARRNQGGGVALDLIHEIDYALYLFGKPQGSVSAFGKFSSLEIDSVDCAAYIFSYANRLVEIHLDYFGRKPKREIEVFCEEGTFLGNLLNNTFENLCTGEKTTFPNIKTDIYEKEMTYFLEKAASRERTFNDIFSALETLRIAEGGI